MSAHERTTTAGGGELAVRLAHRHPRGAAVHTQTAAVGGIGVADRLAHGRPRTAARNKKSSVLITLPKN